MKAGGVFRGIDHLGVRPLAHRVKAHGKHNELVRAVAAFCCLSTLCCLSLQGRFIRLRIQASPASLFAFEQKLRLDEEIIRFMSLRQKHIAPVPPKDPLARSKLFTAHGFTARQHGELDYFVARELLRAGKLTADDVARLRKRFVDAGSDGRMHAQKLDAALLQSRDAQRAAVIARRKDAVPKIPAPEKLLEQQYLLKAADLGQQAAAPAPSAAATAGAKLSSSAQSS